MKLTTKFQHKTTSQRGELQNEQAMSSNLTLELMATEVHLAQVYSKQIITYEYNDAGWITWHGGR